MLCFMVKGYETEAEATADALDGPTDSAGKVLAMSIGISAQARSVAGQVAIATVFRKVGGRWESVAYFKDGKQFAGEIGWER